MKQTRYAQIARDISEGIASGRFPIGSQLPTEAEMCASYGASRHTIRSAMRELQDLGLVSRRKKAGTRVEATPKLSSYRTSIGSIEELAQFGAEHVRIVRDIKDVVADRDLAKTLGRPPGTRWVCFSTVRIASATDDTPIGWTDTYVEETYSDLREIVHAHPELLVSSLIETRYGRRVAEVRQTIRPTLVPASLAEPLRVKPRSPALKIVRQYFDGAGEAFEISITIHPADRFTFSMRLTRKS